MGSPAGTSEAAPLSPAAAAGAGASAPSLGARSAALCLGEGRVGEDHLIRSDVNVPRHRLESKVCNRWDLHGKPPLKPNGRHVRLVLAVLSSVGRGEDAELPQRLALLAQRELCRAHEADSRVGGHSTDSHAEQYVLSGGGRRGKGASRGRGK